MKEEYDFSKMKAVKNPYAQGGTMKNAKQFVQDLLKKVPEDSSLEDIQYHIYVQEKIRSGLKDADEGKTLSQKEVEKRMNRWLGK